MELLFPSLFITIFGLGIIAWQHPQKIKEKSFLPPPAPPPQKEKNQTPH
jgi:hypothetical protein